MAYSSPVIKKIIPLEYGKLAIETNHGVRYEADLSTLSDDYCFPKNDEEWRKCHIDSYGLGVIWFSRFEVHVDQIIGLATSADKSSAVS
jgi:hypothetical protein